MEDKKQIIPDLHGKEAKANNIFGIDCPKPIEPIEPVEPIDLSIFCSEAAPAILDIRINMFDEKPNLIDKKIEEEVDRKVDQRYVDYRLHSSRWELEELQFYKRKITEVNAALEQNDAERVIDALYSYLAHESGLDPSEEELERNSSNEDTHSKIWKPIWKRSEENKAEARKVYQEEGIIGLQRLVNVYFKCDWRTEKIDYLIQQAEKELNRVEEIVNNNPPELARQQLYLFGACHTLWAMKKNILKTDYGIDWETPAERSPGVIFD